MKLLADENIVGLDALPEGIEVRTVSGRAIETAMLEDVDALWVRSVTQVDDELLGESGLRFVGTATAGTEHISLDALKSRGIRFAAAPGSNAMAVVEYVLAALLHLDEPWRRLEEGAALGIVGYGQVGRRLAAFADAMGWSVRVSDPWLKAIEPARFGATLEDVLRCEVISLHCSMTHDAPWPSFHLLDDTALATLTPGQWLINASRGAAVDNRALRARLTAGDAPRVVLDVWEGEPDLDWSLLQAPEVLLATPHIAGYSVDAKWTATHMLFDAMIGAELGAEKGAEKGVETETETGGRSPMSMRPADVSADDAGRAEEVLAGLVGSSGADALRTLMTACYDIRADDQRFRELEALPELDARARGFDQLRKNYPLRREVSVVFADLADALLQRADEAVERFLRALATARQSKGR